MEEEIPEKIKKIADTLLKGGLAITDSEAINKAKEMVETEEKFKKSIREKGVKPVNRIMPGFDEDKSVNELIKEEEEREETD
jgi:hypothetical protein